MPFGIYLSRCLECGKTFKCSDCIDDVCPDCKFKKMNLKDTNNHDTTYYSERKNVVFTNGCFDLFHAGHLHLLYRASMLGELHVGINSDETIRKLKGPGRPIIPQDQRFEILSSIKYVNRVYIFDEPTPKELIEQIMPDIVVKGGDWKPEDVVGRHMAKIITIPLLEGISSTNIINKIRQDHMKLKFY